MKRLMKKLTVLFMVFVLGVSFVACAGAKDKVFTRAGLWIILTDEFVEKEYISQTVCYESPKVAVYALKEEFTMLPGLSGWTLKQYAEQTLDVNGLDSGYFFSEKDYIYFEYEKQVHGNEYTYYATCHKSEDAFWLIQFACFTKNYEDMKKDIVKYADSIDFGAIVSEESGDAV